jgi:hypothetical protein
MNAGGVVAKLKEHFAPPAFCFLEQVADGTGARQHRWADGVAMSVWPSRGYDIHGIEVKVSRHDWQIELNHPKKSEAVQQYCNRWWIATPDQSIIRPGELPPTWGWMICNARGMKVITPAPALTPKEISVEFLASVLRNVSIADDARVNKLCSKAAAAATEEGNKYLRDHLANLKTQVDEFEAASGIRISEYSGGKDLGEAVRTLRDLKYRTQSISEAIHACEQIKGMLENVETLAKLGAE